MSDSNSEAAEASPKQKLPKVIAMVVGTIVVAVLILLGFPQDQAESIGEIAEDVAEDIAEDAIEGDDDASDAVDDVSDDGGDDGDDAADDASDDGGDDGTGDALSILFRPNGVKIGMRSGDLAFIMRSEESQLVGITTGTRSDDLSFIMRSGLKIGPRSEESRLMIWRSGTLRA